MMGAEDWDKTPGQEGLEAAQEVAAVVTPISDHVTIVDDVMYIHETAGDYADGIALSLEGGAIRFLESLVSIAEIFSGTVGGQTFSHIHSDGPLNIASSAGSTWLTAWDDENGQPKDVGIGVVNGKDVYGTCDLFDLWAEKATVNGMPLPTKVLYANATGATGAVVLSESAANFSMIEIFYNANGGLASVKVDSPNGKTVSMMGASTDADWAVFNLRNALISGMTISGGTASNSGRVKYNSTANTITGDRSAVVAIVKVIGYR